MLFEISSRLTTETRHFIDETYSTQSYYLGLQDN